MAGVLVDLDFADVAAGGEREVQRIIEGRLFQTGLDLAEKVAGSWPRVRIIILSGQVRPDAAILPGNALFCTKPCAPGALTTLVRQCVDW
jgi:hypothetical protein